MARIVYFCRAMTEFIRIEQDLLREQHDVTAVECASRWPRPVQLLRRIASCDVALSWFASWHAFVPAILCRLLGKPFVVTVGGYDTARMPEIRYGLQRHALWGLISRVTMRLATRVIVISEFTRSEVLALGIPAGKLDLVYLGLDPERYSCQGVAKEDLVVTVGGVNESNRTRKGLDAFVRSAAALPGLHFAVIGPWTDGCIEELRSMAPPNVQFTGRVSHQEKVIWLARARVVVQASQHEAFGLSLAEGMLCGCVPVVTGVGSLPEVAGDCGVIVGSQEPGELAAGIRRALELGPELGRRARERVLARFTLAEHRRQLNGLLDALLLCRSDAGSERRIHQLTRPRDGDRPVPGALGDQQLGVPGRSSGERAAAEVRR